jgi:pimeloyl-ACP methyl ester carboxylesterase
MHRGIAGGLAIGGMAALLWLGAHRWRRQTVARLNAGSQCIQTARGSIEYSVLYPQAEKTPVLVLHGSPGGYDQAEVIGRTIFNTERTLIAPSRPGYQRTPLQVGKTPGDQAEAMAALLDALDVAKVILLPISGGGPTALEFAARCPDRTAALILASAVTAALDNPVEVSFLQRLDLLAWLTLALAKIVPAVLGQTANYSPAIREAMLNMAGATVPIDLRLEGWINDAEQFTILPPFPFGQICCPTLIIHGSADEIVPYAQAQTAAALIPNATLVTIAGGDHNFSIFAPVEGRQIHNFLRDYAL